ncbi:hypothetical protein Aph02nite_90970 [Actinoplanes philippinensis]|uniref:4-amino-4-deoxy-L-arabinose transferase n=1 Tax=Actinoplanes philippinensis TaxID=35752 RepID=A0A1I2MG28_9ACTN|nr:hypothetical protein [Actinoplanes philippinensis]GIE83147.1 hypothetical protein Aph02nite_90970 [Actinoplanes philippinensis]SFF90423.1 hypothetical protein SAMN05421541_12931 [Actinoplanes philippinensis]
MRRSALRRLALPVTALIVTVLVLAPLAAPGYVLSYDMVFVPRQPLRWDLVLPSATLPRAVPLDALVSLATQVVPGWLLQRLALAAILMLAAVGAGRLVPAERTGARLVAAVAYAWTPYLAERLLLGQWGLLLAYAALPWLAAAALRVRAGDRRALLPLAGWAALAAITPTGGLIALATVAALATSWLAAGMTLLVNVPWLLAVALTDADARSDPDGVAAFAARGNDWTGALGALLGTGGTWNAQTVLPSRASVLAPAGTLALLALAGFGMRELWRRWPVGAATRLAAVAAGGFAVALLGAVPGVRDGLAWLVETVPGAGLLRDGQKFVMPYTLLLCLAVALGAERAAARIADRTAGRVVLGAVLLLPVALQPDLAFGAGNRLRPVAYPADFAVVARLVAADPGPVVSLPLAAYHRYPWNHGRTVLDPLPRCLDAEVLTDDRLVVGRIVVGGEDRRAAAIRQALTTGAPLADLGVRWVVVQRVVGAPAVPVTSLTGLRLVHDGTDLDLYENTLRREVTTW